MTPWHNIKEYMHNDKISHKLKEHGAYSQACLKKEREWINNYVSACVCTCVAPLAPAKRLSVDVMQFDSGYET